MRLSGHSLTITFRENIGAHFGSAVAQKHQMQYKVYLEMKRFEWRLWFLKWIIVLMTYFQGTSPASGT